MIVDCYDTGFKRVEIVMLVTQYVNLNYGVNIIRYKELFFYILGFETETTQL